MKKSAITISALALLSFAGAATFGQVQQSKGIDSQTRQIQDISTQRGPTDNGNKQNVGTGRGIDFGKGKTPEQLPLPNPYRMTSRRDILVTQIADLMRERSLVVDEAASRPREGVLISQPYTFSKGTVLTDSQLSRLADIPGDEQDEAWLRGRYTLTVEVQTIDGINNNVSVTAKVEGLAGSAQGSNWLTLTSSGVAENDFLGALVERITGKAPNDAVKPVDGDGAKNSDNKNKGAAKPAAKPQR